jgi:hypothetical protein
VTADQILVTVAGLLAIAGVAWFFWAPRRAGVTAALTPSGRQEATIVVKGAYTPRHDRRRARHAGATELPAPGDRRLLGGGRLPLS